MLNGLKTYIGAAITAVAAGTDAAGISFPVGEVESMVNHIFEAIGIAIVIYGRWDAHRRGGV